jgi:hypothetical protein
MELGLFKTASKVGAYLVAFTLLIACSPTLNWRTVQAPEQKYTALFPGKPDKLERQIPFEGQELKQALDAVKVDGDIYSITSIQIPANQSHLAQQVLAQLQNNLLDRAKASGGQVSSEDAYYQTVTNQRLPTKDYFITFKANGTAWQTMRARWILRSSDAGQMRIYQLSVLNSKANNDDVKATLSRDEYANFFNEFRPE